jgi:hypothetical protein
MFVKSQFFKIQGEENLQKISDFVREYHQQSHESNYVGGFLRVYEDYSFFMGNDLVVCIRVDLNEVENNKIVIEFIVGGGSSGLFGRDLWTRNNSRINHFKDRLLEFCAANNLQVLEQAN